MKLWSDNPYNPYTMGDQCEELAPHTFYIIIEGGTLQEILNLPAGTNYEVLDLDQDDNDITRERVMHLLEVFDGEQR
jgi:hypothetical protein